MSDHGMRLRSAAVLMIVPLLLAAGPAPDAGAPAGQPNGGGAMLIPPNAAASTGPSGPMDVVAPDMRSEAVRGLPKPDLMDVIPPEWRR